MIKNNIFLYLFVFAVLIAVFQVVNSKKILDKYERDLSRLELKNLKLIDSIQSVNDKIFDLSHFNFSDNDQAQEYFISNFNPNELEALVKNSLMQTNDYKTKSHPLIPYESMTTSKMVINTIKLINHRWVIADFTDGKYWGELILRYYVNDDRSVDFEMSDHLIYH